MKVELISYSQTPDGALKLEQLIAYCARVSNPSNQQSHLTSAKLLKYLAKHKHWSPFEMVNVCLGIETTRDIARQMLRHRSFSFQEFSQRYANPVEEFSFVTREARRQDSSNRQNSVDVPSNSLLAAQWKHRQQELIRLVQAEYRWAIDNGMAKEQARAILPEGLTVSKLYMSGTIRSWMHYIDIRTGVETQKEHRLVAQACADTIATIFKPMEETRT